MDQTRRRASRALDSKSASTSRAVGSWEERFTLKLPRRPYCADDFAFGSYTQPREVALGFRLIQYNEPERRRYLLFDIDRRLAAEAHAEANVGVPNAIVTNPKNGHAHLVYELAEPVTYFTRSREAPIAYARDTERGMVRRLGADRGYSGHLAKNALHPAWRVSRPREAPYALGDIARWLEPDDMRGWAPGDRESGLGRNVTLFDSLRHIAYREVLLFKSNGLNIAQFRSRLLNVASDLNMTLGFISPLHTSEVAGIVKSVTKWTWRHFSPERFSEIQSKRGIRGNAVRWAGHTSLDETRPWEAEGISRRAWFYRQKRQAADSTGSGSIASLVTS